MTHTGSPKRVTFDLESVDITEKATGLLVAKGITNHSTKAYEFSHFLLVSPLQPYCLMLTTPAIFGMRD